MKELLLRLNENTLNELDHISHLKKTTRTSSIRDSLNMYITYVRIHELSILEKMNTNSNNFYKETFMGER